MRGAAVTGWGAALPETVVTNADLAARLDTHDEWIVERTGIRERRGRGAAAPDARPTAGHAAGAAGAVVREAVPGASKLLGCDLGADGSLRSLLYCDHGGFIAMEGQEVFRRAVRATVESARAALERAKVTAEEINLFVPHQANLRIIDAAGQRLGLPRERTALVLDRTGNTSAASIPVALADAV